MKGVILTGGTGSRLRPITHTGPKQLVPVANRPVIEYAIDDLKEAGITEIGMVLGNHGREEIMDHIGDGSKFGVDITYIIQGNPLGLAHATGCAKDFVEDEDFVLYLGDNIIKDGITELVDSFTSGDYGAGIALQEVENPEECGVADVDEDKRIQKITEKPDNPTSNLAIIGIYVFSPIIFEAIERITPSWRGELEITDAIQDLLERDVTIDSRIVTGWWKDTGRPKDIIEANRLVLDDINKELKGTVSSKADLKGMVQLAESATIEEGAAVRGPVSIGENATIKSGTYIGPYTSVGPNSNVSKAHIENSVIVGDAQIATECRIVDSLIGKSAKIVSAENMLPEGSRFTIGENTTIRI